MIGHKRSHAKSFGPIAWQILGIWAIVCFRFLISHNMGSEGWNEADVLPIARQFADPAWIPTDWYLNQPAGYRWLFQLVFGNLAAAIGFLATSLIGRWLCYGMFATGVVLLSRQLKLSFPLLLLAIVLFLNIGNWSFDWHQGAAADEWLVRGLEAKAIAYGLLMLALPLLLSGRDRGAVFLIGLATSFHVLVGGWAFLAAGGLLWLRHRSAVFAASRWRLIPIYLLGSSAAFPAIAAHLTTPSPAAAVPPSYFYVFVRLPHHLNPLVWEDSHWLRLAVFFAVFISSLIVICKPPRSLPWLQGDSDSEANAACLELAQFTGMALVPFAIGVLIAPFDQQGQFLQYYPFRLGDVLLPLNTCLLMGVALQRLFNGSWRRGLQMGCLVLVSVACCVQAIEFQEQVAALRQFPGEQQQVNPKWLDLCTWVRQFTPPDAVVITAPDEEDNFTWLSERATIAKFKFLPQSKAGIIEWSERLNDLSNGHFPGVPLDRQEDSRREIRLELDEEYKKLTRNQAIALMDRYQASYIVTRSAQEFDLPIAYENSRYRLYQRAASLAAQDAGSV